MPICMYSVLFGYRPFTLQACMDKRPEYMYVSIKDCLLPVI